MQDEHYIARGMFENATLPDGTHVKLPTFAPKFNNTPGSTEWVGPPLGAHNNEIYCGQLGMCERELVELREQGII
jgi:crotonobetainyl-CoA:carnitine CoA-transferase CaiB-like acyl-CoA transferase